MKYEKTHMPKYILISIAIVLGLLIALAGWKYGRPSAEPSQVNLSWDQLVQQLRSPDSKVRESAFEILQARAKPGLTRAEGALALQVAGDAFPTQKYEWQDTSVELVRSAAVTPYPEYVSLVAANFSSYNAKTKVAALELLARLPERGAAETYVALVKANARDGALQNLPAGTYAEDQRHADVLFPALLDFADVPELRWDIYLLALGYLEHGALKRPALGDYAERIVAAYKEYEVKLRPLQRGEGVAWMWEENYQVARSNAALLLDILGYVPWPEAKAELQNALRYEDPRLAFFAARALLRNGESVPENDLVRIAKSAETRNMLFDSLRNLKRPELFPQAYATQGALAESDMVGWLTYPTELGRVPDEIELMRVVSENVGGEDGILDFYLFRFRTHEAHGAAKDAWMAGVAGPFRRAASPSTMSLGSTFSTFEKWNEKRPEEHVEEIRAVLREWAERNNP